MNPWRGVLALLLVAADPAMGQNGTPDDLPEPLREVRIETRTTPDSLTVGDRVTLEVRVEGPSNLEVRFPDQMDPDGPVVLENLQVERLAPDEEISTGRTSWIGRYTLGLFAVGDVALPPWPVEVRAGSLQAVVQSDSIFLYVQSVLDDSLAAADLRDIKKQADLAVSPWPWILAGIGLLVALGALVWWIRRRRRPRADVVRLAPPRPAPEVALDALRRLESERLPFEGQFKEYHVRLSEILRLYLEDGFGVAALEQTTMEILDELESRGFEKDIIVQVELLCGESDLVKFAKHEPTIQDCARALDNVRDFVLATTQRSRSAHAAWSQETVSQAPEALPSPAHAGAGRSTA